MFASSQRATRSVWLCSSALLVVAGPVLAQDRMIVPSTEPTQLEEVVVTASGFEQRITQAPASISVIPRAEIEETRATSIAEILTSVEGVDVGAPVGKTGGQTINIRGMGSDYTLILIDGRRQNTAGSVTPNGFGETCTVRTPWAGWSTSSRARSAMSGAGRSRPTIRSRATTRSATCSVATSI